MGKVEERLASFYLGQEYELAKDELLEPQVHYDARDLTTHAVCLGMTGSGKTGLGVILLEEAALDGVPSLVIDPKGDMTNLLLTFPELQPESFRPWVNPDDARRKDMDLDSYAARMADLWRNGLEGTGQGPERIRRLPAATGLDMFGDTTSKAVQHGAWNAVTGAVDRAITTLRSNAYDPAVVLTGGDASRMLTALGTEPLHRPHLVLQGLARLLQETQDER
jgi:hypothetical protein